MKTLKTSAISDRFKFAKLALFAGALLFGASVNAQVIPITNGDFSSGNGSVGGGGAFTNQTIGGATGWRADGMAVGTLILAPTVDISGGDLTISGLVQVSTLVHNGATVYNNNVGTNFVTGQTYVLSVNYSATSALDLTVLGQLGTGISLRAAGVDVANSISNPSLISTSVFNGTTGTINLRYTALAGDNGSNIGVSLFTGQGSGLGVSLLGTVNFDNVTLTAVPEPATWALWGGAASLAVVILQRRKTRLKNNS